MPDYSVFYNLNIRDFASKQLAKFRVAVQESKKELLKMTTSGSAFTQLQQGISGVVAAASPRVMAEWNASWFALQATVGRLFIPIMREASAKIIEVARWIRSITDKQKENIVYWTKIALAVTGLFFAFNKLKPLITGLFAVATSPFLLALTAATGLVGLMLKQMDDMAKRSESFVKDLERMKSGDVNENDIKKSWVGKQLMEIENPEERAKQAEILIAKEQERAKQALQKWNEKSSLGMGASKLAGDYLGISTDYNEMDKIQQDAKNNIGVATAILNRAKEGKALDVKKVETEQDSKKADLASAFLTGQSYKVSSGADQWRSMQTSISNDPQTLALRQVFGSVEEFRKEVNQQIMKTNTEQNKPGSSLPTGGR